MLVSGLGFSLSLSLTGFPFLFSLLEFVEVVATVDVVVVVAVVTVGCSGGCGGGFFFGVFGKEKYWIA